MTGGGILFHAGSVPVWLGGWGSPACGSNRELCSADEACVAFEDAWGLDFLCELMPGPCQVPSIPYQCEGAEGKEAGWKRLFLRIKSTSRLVTRPPRRRTLSPFARLDSRPTSAPARPDKRAKPKRSHSKLEGTVGKKSTQGPVKTWALPPRSTTRLTTTRLATSAPTTAVKTTMPATLATTMSTVSPSTRQKALPAAARTRPIAPFWQPNWTLDPIGIDKTSERMFGVLGLVL